MNAGGSMPMERQTQEKKQEKRGGKRNGSGRPKGSGKYGEPTVAMRIPKSEAQAVLQWIENKHYRLPFYQDAIAAGVPTPASDEIAEKLDLNQLLVKKSASTFLLKVSGCSMIDAAIFDGDLLIVDRSLRPTDGKIVIASVDGELTVKRLSLEKNRVRLLAENRAFHPIEITEESHFQIFGVVVYVIHAL